MFRKNVLNVSEKEMEGLYLKTSSHFPMKEFKREVKRKFIPEDYKNMPFRKVRKNVL